MFFLVLLLLSSIGFIATDIYLPSLPFIVRDFAITKTLVQLTLASYLLSFGLSQLYYGALSEKIGRKKTVGYGLFLMLIGSITCIFSPSITFLIIGRFIEGAGLGATASIFKAILRDVYKGDDLSQKGSYVAVCTAIGMSAAPAIGGYIQYYLDWRFNFVFISIYTVLLLILVYFFLGETHKAMNPKAIKWSNLIEKYMRLIRSPIFMGYTGCGTLTFGGLTAYLTVSPFLFQNVLGLTSVEYGWLAIFISIGLGFGGVANSFFVKKVGRHQLLKIGTLIQGIAGVLMLALSLIGKMNVTVIMVPMLIYMFGAGFVFTNAFAGAFHFFSSIAGYAGALYGTIQVFGGTVFAVIMSFVYSRTQIHLAIALIVVGALNFFLQKMGHKFTLECEK